ncbi:MAG: SemiSWEET transporter [Deltaproteobacteria bacterium]|jgi:MtN3 and saliva related transmembrane protein|nr:SemiSWEET transporter [Myxococcales bacterium]MDP3213597.1 SemiSWEET transporter [Deltaproteobacteria bacterium]
MTGIELIGYAAASLTTASLVPQARLLYRTRNTSGVSLGMYSAFTVGVALWLAYGVLLSAWPVILANVVTLALAVTILAMKLRYG